MDQPSWKQRAHAALDSRDPIAIAGKTILAMLYEKMTEREAGTKSGEDVEELHQMRIATRQMRSLLRHLKGVYGKKRIRLIRDRLKRAGDILGEARDLDSFGLVLLECKSEMPESVHPAIEHLLNEQKRNRPEKQENVLAYLMGDEYRQLKSELRQLIKSDTNADWETPPLELAGPQILLADFDTLLTYKQKASECSLEELHRLRIECKHLRYISEFLQPVYKPAMKKFSQNVGQLQSLLGRVQDKRRDMAYLSANESDILRDLSTANETAAFKQMMKHYQKNQQKNLKKFYNFWEEFTKPKIVKKHRKLIVNGVKSPLFENS